MGAIYSLLSFPPSQCFIPSNCFTSSLCESPYLLPIPQQPNFAPCSYMAHWLQA